MTKQDYELIAKVINREQQGCGPYEGVNPDSLAEAFATQLGQENPRFNREVFLTACGVA